MMFLLPLLMYFHRYGNFEVYIDLQQEKCKLAFIFILSHYRYFDRSSLETFVE